MVDEAEASFRSVGIILDGTGNECRRKGVALTEIDVTNVRGSFKLYYTLVMSILSPLPIEQILTAIVERVSTRSDSVFIGPTNSDIFSDRYKIRLS